MPGATVMIWTIRDGQVTGPPLDESQISGRVVLTEALAAVVLGGRVAIIGVLARRELNRRRMAAWDADWQANGPRWTTRA